MSWTNDPCGNIWAAAYQTGNLVFPEMARVLEIGCAEFDWISPMLELRPDLQIIGIDWRPMPPDRKASSARILRGDVLQVHIPPETFDAIVCISSIEHIGLGHYNNDPLAVDGDMQCADRILQWLKPGGWFYADVPWGSHFAVEGTTQRTYREADVCERLIPPGLWLERMWHVKQEIPYVAFVARKPDDDLKWRCGFRPVPNREDVSCLT